MNLKRTLLALVGVVVGEAERNPAFAAQLEEALGGADTTTTTKRSRARAQALVDPVAVLDDGGEAGLREHLRPLTLDQLLDVVAEFGMDPAKLVMKWKSADRIVDHIVDSSRRRSAKGDAFRA